MTDISQLLLDATTIIKVMKEKSANMSNENLFDLENHSRALRQISKQMLEYVDEKRKQ
jgi:hypothetical protein